VEDLLTAHGPVKPAKIDEIKVFSRSFPPTLAQKPPKLGTIGGSRPPQIPRLPATFPQNPPKFSGKIPKIPKIPSIFAPFFPAGPTFNAPGLTPHKPPGVKSPGLGRIELPGGGKNPLAEPEPNPETEKDKCKCPKPRKPRSGRGFFRVSSQGTEKRVYWKTGRRHNKEYERASNSSRSVGGRRRVKLKLIRGLRV
jgi:hypothetical protein